MLGRDLFYLASCFVQLLRARCLCQLPLAALLGTGLYLTSCTCVQLLRVRCPCQLRVVALAWQGSCLPLPAAACSFPWQRSLRHQLCAVTSFTSTALAGEVPLPATCSSSCLAEVLFSSPAALCSSCGRGACAGCRLQPSLAQVFTSPAVRCYQLYVHSSCR